MKWIAPALAVLLMLISSGLAAEAHGGGQLVAGPVQTGPYTLSVWVNPPQPRAGEPLHFTVGVADPDDGAPVLDAGIVITMQDTAQDLPPLTAEATTGQSVNRLFYETDIDLEKPGPYQATVAVAGPEGRGDLTVELDVEPPSRVNWFLLGLVGLSLVLIVGWWRSRSGAQSSE